MISSGILRQHRPETRKQARPRESSAKKGGPPGRSPFLVFGRALLDKDHARLEGVVLAMVGATELKITVLVFSNDLKSIL